MKILLAVLVGRPMRVLEFLVDATYYIGIILRRLAGMKVTLVIGDSHALFLCGVHSGSSRKIRPTASPGAYVVWLGPKLLHSIASAGFPGWVRPLMSGFFSWHRNMGRIRADIVVGEIDIRCHLAPRLASGGTVVIDDLAGRFVTRLKHCVEGGGIGKLLFYQPVPPTALCADGGEFPRAGSLMERVHCHRLLSRAIEQRMKSLARAGYPVFFVANPDEAVLADGTLNPDWSVDGCHLNRPTYCESEPEPMAAADRSSRTA
jgi:hypothetical protein